MVRVISRALFLLVVGLSFLAIIRFSLIYRIRAAENILPNHQVSVAPTNIQPKPLASFGKLPLSFETNQGQTDARVRFLARGRGYTLFLTGDEAVVAMSKDVAQHPLSGAAGLQGHLLASHLNLENGADNDVEGPQDRRAGPALRMRLIGANANAAVTGADELPGKSNYFIGNDPKKWRTNVPNYSKVKYQNVYPGVDLVYYGNQRQLEYDFVVAPGADPSAIVLDVGAVGEPPTVAAVYDRRSAVGTPPLQERAHRDAPLQIAPDGDLVVKVDDGEVRFHQPIVYQPDPPSTASSSGSSLVTRHSSLLDGRFVLTASNQVRFAVAPYDRTKPLVIDPVLSYSTYLGGSNHEGANGIAVDSLGNAYITGLTNSTDFPTVNPPQATNHAYPNSNVFVAKLNSAGSALVYSTYLGGSGLSEDGVNVGDSGYGIAVDSSGNAYVTGTTASVDFPTVNPLQASPHGAFVAKLNATGSALVYSTYLGGSSSADDGYGIAVDSSGNAYVTGATTSRDFPTVNPLQATYGGGAYDAFVVKFNPAGSALIYSTYLGGSGFWGDFGQGIAVDSSGNAYVTGQTCSTDFPTANPIQISAGSECSSARFGGDAFVAKLNAAGSALVYSTYLGGTGDDLGLGIATDSSGNAYVVGSTESTNFPTANALQPNNAGDYQVFVAKLNAAGTALVYSTYLGGNKDDFGYGIAADSSGNAYVTGATSSPNFPTVNPLQATNHTSYPNTNAFIAKLNSAGSALAYSTYLGGSGGERGLGIAVDTSGNAYATGATYSTDFPTMNPLQATNHGNDDVFVAKILPGGAAPLVNLSPLSLTFGAQNVDTASAAQTVTVTNTGTANLTISTVLIGGTNAGDFATSADTCTGATVTPNSDCTVSVTFTPSATGTRSASLIFTDNASNSPQTLGLTGVGGTAPPVAGVSPSSLTFSNQNLGTTSGSQSVTLSNSGNEALTITSIATSANFGQINNCTGSVAGDGSCTIYVTFTPGAIGPLNGTLTITDNSNGVANSTQSVALSGTGQDFTLAVAGGSSTSATGDSTKA
jgi:hypothetical protein